MCVIVITIVFKCSSVQCHDLYPTTHAPNVNVIGGVITKTRNGTGQARDIPSRPAY